MRFLPRVLLFITTGIFLVAVNADPTGQDRNAAARILEGAGIMGTGSAVPHHQDVANDIAGAEKLLQGPSTTRQRVASARRWAEAKFTRPSSRAGFGANARGGRCEFGAFTRSGLP